MALNDVKTPYFCVFHIPTASYIMCHISKHYGRNAKNSTESIETYLLEPGVNYNYDCMTVMFKGTDKFALLIKIKSYIERRQCLHYNDRSFSEFEIHDFNEKLVPLNVKYREYHNDGRTKADYERSF